VRGIRLPSYLSIFGGRASSPAAALPVVIQQVCLLFAATVKHRCQRAKRCVSDVGASNLFARSANRVKTRRMAHPISKPTPGAKSRNMWSLPGHVAIQVMSVALMEWLSQPFSEGTCPTQGLACDCGQSLTREHRIQQQVNERRKPVLSGARV